MRNRPHNTALREASRVASSAAITLVGAWLLVLATGMVAIFAVLLATALYVPLRCRSGPKR